MKTPKPLRKAIKKASSEWRKSNQQDPEMKKYSRSKPGYASTGRQNRKAYKNIKKDIKAYGI